MNDNESIAAGAEAAELERCRAISEQDWPALDALLADELTHTHNDGRVEDKATLIAGLRGRARTLRRGPLHTRVHGDIAIVVGPQYMSFADRELENQATEVWQLRDGRWQLLAFHGSMAPPAD